MYAKSFMNDYSLKAALTNKNQQSLALKSKQYYNQYFKGQKFNKFGLCSTEKWHLQSVRSSL